MLIFLAANGLHPLNKPNTVNLTYTNTTMTVTVPLLLYNADRNMTQTEYKILARVRKGCGRLYIRSFVEQWDRGKLVHWAFGLQLFAIVILPISALTFLMLVPGVGNYSGKLRIKLSKFDHVRCINFQKFP